MMKRTAIVLLALGMTLAAAFWWLDFRVASSQNQVSYEVASGSSGGARDALLAEHGNTLQLYLPGDDATTHALYAGLVNHPDLRPLFNSVRRIDDLDDVAHGYLLVVETGERTVFWTPIYGKSAVVAEVAFSSNGDVSWRGDKVFSMVSGEPTVMVRGTYAIADMTTGLLSHRSYESHLGQQLGQSIGQSLGTELNRHTPEVPTAAGR